MRKQPERYKKNLFGIRELTEHYTTCMQARYESDIEKDEYMKNSQSRLKQLLMNTISSKHYRIQKICELHGDIIDEIKLLQVEQIKEQRISRLLNRVLAVKRRLPQANTGVNHE